jgi:hypothetical protein
MNKRKTLLFFLLVIFFLISPFFVLPAKASTSNGTIDATNKYVWASKIGWINFGATNGNVVIADSALTGSVWSQNYGWINLAPTLSGVANNSEGTLSGYAWGSNLGWINFSGVIINSSGKFTGTATGENVGTINFDCANCNVTTDWRPASTRASSNQTTSGGVGAVANPAPSLYTFSINNNESETNSPSVNLYLKGDNNTAYIWASEDPDLVPVKQIFYQPTNGQMIYPYVLSESEGIKTVYVKFCNNQGYCGNLISDSINYKIISQIITKNPVTTTEKKSTIKPIVILPIEKQVDKIVADKTIVQKVSDTLKKIASKINLLIPDFLKPWEKSKELKNEDITQFVSKTTPLTMMGIWELLPKEPIKQYVFAPLPEEFKALAQKFPSIGSLFSETGVESMQDLRKLADAKINVPSLGKVIGLKGNKIVDGILTQEQKFTIDKLPNDLKVKIPTEMVFARGSNQLVDYGTILTLSADGQPVQKLKTISGKKLFLSIKPEFKAKSIKGYLTFISRPQTLGYESQNLAIRLLEKINLLSPVSAKESVLSLDSIEKKLVLEEFTYQDDNNDGIYTAEVYSPVPAGEYEVLTVIEYQDSKNGTKLVRLVTVVDPEGYVFEKIKGKELRISNALVSLYWLNPQTKNYELWPADKYQQQNGQVTDVRGSYSFLVPLGSYYLRVQAAGYQDYQSELFKVSEGEGVHMNLELQSESWWTKAWDWKTWAIILLIMTLLYMIEREYKLKVKN